jgi:hypothetical protein
VTDDSGGDLGAPLARVFAELADTIRERAGGRELVYVPNPGNYGDGLIRYATKQFFADHTMWHHEVNIGFRGGRYQLLPFLLARDKFFFIYGGGGSWSKTYDFGLRNCTFISRFTDRLLVLPSTLAMPVDRVRGTVYRRDRAESATYAPAARFCHDMAFYLAASPSTLDFAGMTVERGRGIMMRTDGESLHGASALAANNFDLSRRGDHMSDGASFIRQVAAHSEIETDRLHIAIAACIARRRVLLKPGNYFKIRAIFESSLRPYFAPYASLDETLPTLHAAVVS